MNSEEIIKKYNEFKYKEFIGEQSAEREANNVPIYMLHEEKQKANFFLGIKPFIYSKPDKLGKFKIIPNRQGYVGKPPMPAV